jgi:hypothetical protein
VYLQLKQGSATTWVIRVPFLLRSGTRHGTSLEESAILVVTPRAVKRRKIVKTTGIFSVFHKFLRLVANSKTVLFGKG